jgi:nicotinamide-nucleotide amidase
VTEAGAQAEASAAYLLEALIRRGFRAAIAESCTGGLATALLTALPGASKALWGGVVAYSNECKTAMIGVDPDTIRLRGAVSRETAREMAAGLLERSGAELSIAVTGIAGPDGGSPDKPVGLVWFAWRLRSGEAIEEEGIFPGDRGEVRRAAAAHALRRAAELVGGGP